MTDWKKRVADTIKVNDQVQYSRGFLKSTGQITGPVPFAKGIVAAIKDLGGLQIATVDWDTADLPARINVKNLNRVGQREVE